MDLEITESDLMRLSEVGNGARGPGDQLVAEDSGAIVALPTEDLSSPSNPCLPRAFPCL